MLRWFMPGLLVLVLVCAVLYAFREARARAEPKITSVLTIHLQENLEAGTVTLRRKDFDAIVDQRNALYGTVTAYQLKGCR